MILVTGATGNIGAEVVRLLLDGKQAVRVLARDPAKVSGLKGVQVVQGDLMKPSSLAAAFAGVEKAFIMVASIQDIPTASGPIFQAARDAKVRHVVFLSSGTILMKPPTTVGKWHLAGEEALKATGLQWTMIRPGNFASNSLRWAGPIKGQASVYAAHGDHLSAVIDPRDIAAVVAKALTTPGHEGKTHVLTGPALISQRQQMETLARVLGKPIKFVEVPEAGARANMLRVGMPEVMVDAVLELSRPTTTQDEPVNTTVLDVTGQAPRGYEAWARDHAHLFAG